MCSNFEDHQLQDQLNPRKVIAGDRNTLKKCKKCREKESFVLLQKVHSFCRSCFTEMCHHKFRSTIGKSHLIKFGSRVLIAFSGGPSSCAMLSFLKESLYEKEVHRNLRLIPIVLHVDESMLYPNEIEGCPELLKKSMVENEWDCYTTSIEYSLKHDSPTFLNQLYPVVTKVPGDEDLKSMFLEMIERVDDPSSKQELIRRLRMKLIVAAASELKCDYIFLSTSGRRLAAQLITDMAQGKGNQIHLETGFCDERFGIPILKPMREFSTKEVVFYNVSHGIQSLLRYYHHQKTPEKLSDATETLLNTLEADFPQTIYSLCRISTKIHDVKRTDTRCILCQAENDTLVTNDCSALSALRISQRLSSPESDTGIYGTSLYCHSCSRLLNNNS